MTPANAVAAFAQIAVLVAVCAGLPRLLRLRAPGVQYLFWRAVLAACIFLPIFQPRKLVQMVFVPAPAGAALPLPGTDAIPALNVPPASATIDWWIVAAVVIVAGIVGRLAWMAAGIRRLIRMRARAHEEAVGFEDLKGAIGAAARICWSTDVRHPVTFGLFRPVVLLPVALKAVDAAAQRAVVAHELHHVKRRDWLWVVAEEVMRSVLWFHPAVWWLISRVQLARETVVDELSILTTNARRTYLDTLLAFADDTGLDSSPAFSARRHLFHRVMLLSKEGGMSSFRIAVASCVLAAGLGAGSWGAVSTFPLYESSEQQPPPPPPPPPRDPLGPEAYVRLGVSYFEQINRTPSLTAEQTRQLAVAGIAAQDRALELKPNYADAMVWKSILLRLQANVAADSIERDRLINEANALREQVKVLIESGRAYVSRDAINRPPPPPPPPPPSPSRGSAQHQMAFSPAPPMSEQFETHAETLGAVRVGSGIKVPVKVRDVRPLYPPIAQQAQVQGVVIVEALLDEDGNVANARVLRSIPLLDEAALDSVRQWKYTPTLLNGVPSAVLMTVTVNFRLPQAR
jgi:TonB family protein